MRIINSILPALVLLGATASDAVAQGIQQQAKTVNVMSYNIRNGVGLDGKRNPARIAEVIRRSGADVVCMQEVDSMTGRSGGRYVAGDIAAEALMYPIFAPAIDYDGGKYGIAVLAKNHPLSVRRVALPGREEARALLLVEFDDYVLACTHLSLTEDDRNASAEIIRHEAAAYDKPLVLCGDFNAHPDDAVMKELKATVRPVTNPKRPTYPADKPEETIDYICVSTDNAPAVLGTKVVDEPVASDHRPIMATLRFKTPANQLLYHKPYIQNPSTDGMTVMYQSTVPVTSRVEYGTDTVNLTSVRQLIAGQEVVHDMEHKVRLSGLRPGTRYYYRVCAREITENSSYHKTFGDSIVTPFYSFVTLPEEKKEMTVLVLNDLHEYMATIDTLAAMASKIPHDMVIFNGDCLPEPYDREYAVQWLHVLSDRFDGANTPIMYIRGNHEIRNAYSSGMPSLFDNPGGKTYGAFTLGGTRFIVLDCGEDKTDDTWVYYGLNDFTGLRREQADWLRQEMSSREYKKADNRILIHHIPVWGNTDEYQPCTDMWAPILGKGKFAIDIAAHTHEHKIHPKGSIGNPCVTYIGGGPKPERATMLVLTTGPKGVSARVVTPGGTDTVIPLAGQ